MCMYVCVCVFVCVGCEPPSLAGDGRRKVQGQYATVVESKRAVPSFHGKLQTSGLMGVDAEPFCVAVRAGASGEDCDATGASFIGDDCDA